MCDGNALRGPSRRSRERHGERKKHPASTSRRRPAPQPPPSIQYEARNALCGGRFWHLEIFLGDRWERSAGSARPRSASGSSAQRLARTFLAHGTLFGVCKGSIAVENARRRTRAPRCCTYGTSALPSCTRTWPLAIAPTSKVARALSLTSHLRISCAHLGCPSRPVRAHARAEAQSLPDDPPALAPSSENRNETNSATHPGAARTVARVREVR
ncbi:hypothetical protein C8Q77DRAFT_582701 [Trametes polyzona]|nr:hypothetical protein C8Q77DRAFT_582701 [Trametes polyzona]